MATIFSAKLVVFYLDRISPWVCSAWVAELMLAVGFSRFARWKARRGGGDWWASFALLPAYEAAIVYKKAALAVIVLTYALTDWSFSSEAELVRNWICFYLNFFAIQLYTVSYATVMYVLCAKSAGTVTLRRAIGTTLMLALVIGGLQFLAYAGVINRVIVSHNYAHNTTFAMWPSFNRLNYSSLITSVPGVEQVTYEYRGTAAGDFWWGVTGALLGTIGMALACTDVWRPRRMGLAAALLALLTVTEFLFYFADFKSIKSALGFEAWVLLGIMEMPLQYYIMLLDSRTWSTLSLTGDNSPHSLDTLQNEMVGQVALCMQSLHTEMAQPGAERAPHLHWTSLEFDKVIAQGAAGKVWHGRANGVVKAIKQISCDELDRGTVHTVTREVEVSWLLARDCPRCLIVRFDGFSLDPPFLYVVMEMCTRGSLTDVLGSNELSYLQRLQMARDVMAAMAHIHELSFLHRDMKSLNCFVTDLNGDTVVRLGDFGETITFESAQHETRRQVGTTQW